VALSRQRQAEGNQASTATDEAAQRVAALRQGLASQEVGFDSRLAEQNLAASGRLQASHDAQTTGRTPSSKARPHCLAEQRRANDLEQARYPRRDRPAAGARRDTGCVAVAGRAAGHRRQPGRRDRPGGRVGSELA
jgi:hypothetical protein